MWRPALPCGSGSAMTPPNGKYSGSATAQNWRTTPPPWHRCWTRPGRGPSHCSTVPTIGSITAHCCSRASWMSGLGMPLRMGENSGAADSAPEWRLPGSQYDVELPLVAAGPLPLERNDQGRFHHGVRLVVGVILEVELGREAPAGGVAHGVVDVAGPDPGLGDPIVARQNRFEGVAAVGTGPDTPPQLVLLKFERPRC